MTEKHSTETTAQPIRYPGRITWLACVLFATVPLGLFLLLLQMQTPGLFAMPMDSSPESALAAETLHPNAVSVLSASLFDYSVLTFIHSLICILAAGFFIVRMIRSGSTTTNAVLCAVFSAILIGALIAVVSGPTAFKGYMIDPILNVVQAISMPTSDSARFAIDQQSFTTLLVFPTALGIIAVFLASGSFHARICFPPDLPEHERASTPEALLKSIQPDLIVLSVLLVSSTVTARSFLHLTDGLIAGEYEAISAQMSAVAESLSTASGMLFSATLVAAFLPGCLIVISGLRSKEGTPLLIDSVLSDIAEKSGFLSERFRRILQTLLAIVAPAFAAPVAEFLKGFA
ncbi:MAG: hypothetical protein AAGK01_05670 [Pseudomonadota bacterium]